MSNTPTVLILPGYQNSGPQHWQTLWEQEHPEYRRVQQRDWENPNKEEWIRTFNEAVRAATAPVVVVAHSLGCITVAHWAARGGQGIAAALLVAPPDPERPGASLGVKTFAPMPLKTLPFPSIYVVSSNDPWSGIERARFFARKWGSRFVDIGARGHINSDSNLGSWEQGKQLLEELMAPVVESTD